MLMQAYTCFTLNIVTTFSITRRISIGWLFVPIKILNGKLNIDIWKIKKKSINSYFSVLVGADGSLTIRQFSLKKGLQENVIKLIYNGGGGACLFTEKCKMYIYWSKYILFHIFLYKVSLISLNLILGKFKVFLLEICQFKEIYRNNFPKNRPWYKKHPKKKLNRKELILSMSMELYLAWNRCAEIKFTIF